MPDVITESVKPLTESEVAKVLKDYRSVSTTIEDLSKSNETFKYIVEGEQKSIKSDIISRLFEQTKRINAGN